MTLLLRNRLTDWNPQLFRELKGRLKPRNLALAVTGSLLGQLLVLFYFWSQLPVEGSTYSYYCLKNSNSDCIQDALGNFAINWAAWWLDIFRVLGLGSFLILLIGGVYTLAADLAEEQRRGTLNFIRLSPQSSQSILTGKILGVPALIYLAFALSVPLQWWAGLAAGAPFPAILGGYTFSGAVCFFFYSAALLYVFLGGAQAWIAALVAWSCGWPFIMMAGAIVAETTEKDFDWNKESGLALLCGFVLINVGLWTYGIWQALNRRFCNPSATVLSKKQSYFAVALFQLSLLVIALPSLTSSPSKNSLFEQLYVVAILNLCWFLAMIAAMSPDRQALLDWARYRSTGTQSFQNRSVVSDLIWGEKSPMPVAIAIQLAIAAALWVLWILLWPQNEGKLQAILGVIAGVNLLLIYAALAQLMQLIKARKPAIWAAGAVGAAIFLPLAVFLVLSATAEKVPVLWLFSIFPWLALEHASATTVFLAFIAQWSILGLLSAVLARKLQRAGESASKALLAGATRS
ncbi:hypothetical protein [Kamptonema formosum]|uniref:hypothetical protein n=1 Tax=Kamptonema formosum TaxID=331992 RepID=UPI000348CFA2|nr:hypothetical protein [Oscillatoria sp. PCC 10802]